MSKELFLGLESLPEQRPILLQGSVVEHVRKFRMRRSELMQQLVDYLFEVKRSPVIFVPAFTFSVFNSLLFESRMPSEMGYISENFECLPRILRTSHPIYSFYCIRNQSINYFNIPLDIDQYFAFGKHSFFSYLVDIRTCQVCLDLPDRKCMTFYHHAEKMIGAPHRIEKVFNTMRKSEYDIFHSPCSVYVRKDGVRTNVNGMEARMWNDRVWNGACPNPGNPTERWLDLNSCLDLFQKLGNNDFKGLLYEETFFDMC